MFSITPPIPVRQSRYTCGKRFDLDQLKGLYEDRPYYALIIMNARESRFWMANDLEIKEMKKIEMNVANSHQKGGSSAGRFDRIFENKRDRNNTYQVETILKTYYDFDINRPKVLGFIIGGAAETRSRVFGDAELNIISNHIVANIPWLNSDPYTLYEATREARETYEKNKTLKIKLQVEELIDKSPDIICFGVKEVTKNVDLHLLRKCYVSSDHIDLQNLSKMNAIVKGKCELLVVDDDWLSKWGDCIGIFMSNSKAVSDDDDDDEGKEEGKDKEEQGDKEGQVEEEEKPIGVATEYSQQ